MFRGRNSFSQGTLACSKVSGKLSLLFFGLVLSTLMVLPGWRKTAVAQTSCLAACEQQLAQCLQQSGEDPVPEGACYDAYEACVEDCLSRTRARVTGQVPATPAIGSPSGYSGRRRLNRTMEFEENPVKHQPLSVLRDLPHHNPPKKAVP